MFRVKCWQCRLCTSGSPPSRSPIDSPTVQWGAHLLARGSEIVRCCRSSNITHTKVSYKYLIRISQQHSNDNAVLEGKQCCHVIMLSKCENTTYLRKFDSITRKLAIVCNGCHMYEREMKLWCIFGISTRVTRFSKVYHLNGTWRKCKFFLDLNFFELGYLYLIIDTIVTSTHVGISVW